MLKIFSSILTNKSLLLPKYRLDNVNEMLRVPQLMAAEKTVYIFDKDDTLVPLHQFRVHDERGRELLSVLRQKGKRVFVVSNSVRKAGEKVVYLDREGKEQAIEILHTKKKKPYNIEQLKQIIEKSQNLTLTPTNTVLIGDRLLTDIVLGNMQGWTTVLVSPIEASSIGKHGAGVFLMRKLQNILLKMVSN